VKEECLVENTNEKVNTQLAIWAMLNVTDVWNPEERKDTRNVDFGQGMVNDIVSFLSLRSEHKKGKGVPMFAPILASA
jgi:hypothetical protein